jgi:GR25 family glycosyltransferase involved in LPS biosynthesis
MVWKIEDIPAYCITLDRRLDRWRHFQDQPGSKKLSRLRRYIGVDGKTLDIKNDERVALTTKRNILNKTRRSHEELDSAGGVGCALSHINCWQTIVDNNYEMAVIFEDDAMLNSTSIERINTFIRSSTTLRDPSNWDLFLLGAETGANKVIKDDPVCEEVGVFYQLHAYVLTKKGAEKLLKEVYPIHAHIDMWVSIYKYVYGNFRIVKPIGINIPQRDLKTDIQSKQSCVLCDVPIDYWKTQTLVNKNELFILRMAMVFGGAYMLYYIGKNII